MRQIRSSQLSLKVFIANLEKWQIDEDKLTFIILAPNHPPSGGDDHEVCLNFLGPSDPRLESMPMIGDVNLFLKGSRRDNRQDVDVEDDFEAEVEIMIAGE